MIDDAFLQWVKTAKGSDLMRFKSDDANKIALVDAELERRIDANSIPLLDGLIGALAGLATEKDEK